MDKNFLQDILKKLKKKGVEEADVVFSCSKYKSSSCRRGEIEKTEESVTNDNGDIETQINSDFIKKAHKGANDADIK